MKIVFLAPDAYPVSFKTGGSVEITIYQLAKRLAQEHKVTIISRKSRGLPRETKKGNLTIIRISRGKHYLKKAIRYLKRHSFDCIQVDNRPSHVKTLRRHFPSKPIVLSLHSLTFMNFLSDNKKEEVFEKADKIVCNSEFIQRHYQEEFPKFADKLCAIHLGVDLERFTTSDPFTKEQEKLSFHLQDTYNILYVGRVIAQKGVHILIQAAGIVKQKYPNIRVVIVGKCRSKYQMRLLEEAEKAGVEVRFMGQMNPSEIHRAYRIADCFVCPTQFKEAFGLVNVEAMASGVPVVASHRGGIPEIINESNGILVNDYQDPTAFALAIEQLLNSPVLVHSLVVNGYYTVVNKFSWEHVSNRYDQLYRSFETEKNRAKK